MKKAKKIFVGNYKGGVGKTTSIYQIARHLVLNGKKVLATKTVPAFDKGLTPYTDRKWNGQAVLLSTYLQKSYSIYSKLEINVEI